MSEGILHKAAILAVVACLFSGCQHPAPQTDPTPPQVTLVKWEKNAQGNQGPQTTINPGGSFTVDNDWLGPNRADIRISARDNEGVSRLDVWGTAYAFCSAAGDTPGTVIFTNETISLPTQTEAAKPNMVEDGMTIHLDSLLNHVSCGELQPGGLKHPKEFTMIGGTWTIHAKAKNCCNVESPEAVFTIKVE